MKKLVATTALFGVLLAVGMSMNIQPIETARADGFGCPSGDTWFLASEFLVIPSIDRGDFTDYNGDGLLCLRIPRGFCGNRGQGDGAPVCGAWVWKDNDNPS